MKKFFLKIKGRIQKLSFRTGIIVLSICVPFYIMSFAQMLLPISTQTKGVLWIILFGLAKTFQYAGITILGVEGMKRLKAFWKKKDNKKIFKTIKNSQQLTL